MDTDDKLWLARLWRETSNRVAICTQRVAENRDVEAALEFARYVFWSGMLELFDAYAQPFPLKIDGALLRWQVKELQEACLARFRANDTRPHVTELQLQSIHEKLDLVAGFLARFPQPLESRSERPSGQDGLTSEGQASQTSRPALPTCPAEVNFADTFLVRPPLEPLQVGESCAVTACGSLSVAACVTPDARAHLEAKGGLCRG